MSSSVEETDLYFSIFKQFDKACFTKNLSQFQYAYYLEEVIMDLQQISTEVLQTMQWQICSEAQLIVKNFSKPQT